MLILWDQLSNDSDLWSEKVGVGEVGGNALGLLVVQRHLIAN